MEDLDATIERLFGYHAPKDDQPSRYTTLREYARELARAIGTLTPVSNEQDRAIDALSEALMWANAAIARNE